MNDEERIYITTLGDAFLARANWLSCIIWVLGVSSRKERKRVSFIRLLMIWLLRKVRLIGVKRVAVAMSFDSLV